MQLSKPSPGWRAGSTPMRRQRAFLVVGGGQGGRRQKTPLDPSGVLADFVRGGCPCHRGRQGCSLSLELPWKRRPGALPWHSLPVKAEGEGAGVTRRAPWSIHHRCGRVTAGPEPGERSAPLKGNGGGGGGLLSDILTAVTTHCTLSAWPSSPGHRLLGPGVMRLCWGGAHAGPS